MVRVGSPKWLDELALMKLPEGSVVRFIATPNVFFIKKNLSFTPWSRTDGDFEARSCWGLAMNGVALVDPLEYLAMAGIK